MASRAPHECWRLNLRLLTLCGLWPLSGDSLAERVLGSVYRVFAVACFFVFYLSIAVYTFLAVNDLEVLGENVSITLTNTLTFVKMAPFLMRHGAMRQIVDRGVATTARVAVRSLGRDLYPAAQQLAGGARPRVLRASVRRARRLTATLLGGVLLTQYSVLVVPLATLLLAAPCPSPVANATANATAACAPWQPALPFKVWLPWDWRRPSAFPPSYLLQALAGTMTTLISGSLDTFFIALLLHTCAQFRLLGFALRLAPPARSPGTPQADAAECAGTKALPVRAGDAGAAQADERLPQLLQRLRRADPRETHLLRCAVLHQQLLQFVNDMRWVMSPVLFAECLVMMVVLCMITLHATSVPPNSMEFVSFFAFYALEMSQLLLYCWFCSDLKNQSEEISAAAYASDWTSANPPVKHNVAIFMQCAATPMKLDALGFVDVDLQLFTSVMQTSYSYYTVLSQMKHAEEV